MRRCSLICSALIAVALPAQALAGQPAEERPSNLVVVIGEAHLPDGSKPGAAGSFEWLRRYPSGGVSVGGFAFSMDRTGWSYGRLGAFKQWGKLILLGAADVGRASAGEEASLYHRLEAGAARAVLGGRVVFEGAALHFKGLALRERVFRAGATVQLPGQLQMNATYHLIDAGEEISPGISTRVDIPVKRVKLLTGVAGSRRGSASQPVGPIGVGSLRSREVFAGCRFPTRAGEFVATGTVIHNAGHRIMRAQAGLSIPVGKPEGTRP